MTGPFIYYVAAGLCVGIMVGLTGVGGGSLMTPLLILVFGQSPSVAVGTDLAFAAVTKGIATAFFGYSRRVDWQIVGLLILGSVPGAGAAITWFALAPSPIVVDHLVSRVLAAMLGLTAIALLLQHPLRHLRLKVVARMARAKQYQRVFTVMAGFFLGAAVTLTSVGAGAVGTVALVWLYSIRLPSDRLVATDVAHALPITVIAGVGHAALGHLNLPVLACLLIGSIPGVLLASRVVIRLPQEITRGLIAVMLVVAASRMLLNG
ncbi:MAG TPA: sulfite exporter TauE/SafE family protein [Steroidobacteraceae bacterium]|nr:sulfite exporter TauE/SafE family protein [Steroidobacteraceae bacterium]